MDGNSHVNNDRPEPLSPSTKIRRANIVSRLASKLIIFKQGIGEGCIQEYGADKHFFFQHKFLYRDWLNLGSIKSAAQRQILAEKNKQTVANTSSQLVPDKAISVTPAVSVSSIPRPSSDNAISNQDDKNSPLFCLQPLAPLFPTPVKPTDQPNMGRRPVGSTKEAK